MSNCTSNARPIHICHLVYSFDTGGLEHVVLNCVNGLDKNKYRHTVVALTGSGELAPLLPNNAQFTCLHKPPGNPLSFHRTMWKALKTLQPDVVHSYNTSTIEYQFWAFLAGVPFRMHADHGRDIFDPEGKNKKYQWLRRILSPFINKFICISDDLYRWLTHDVNISAKKAALIYNGIDTHKFSPKAKEHVASSPSTFSIGTVARLAQIKDQQTMLEAFYLLTQQVDDDITLHLVGGGPLQEQLQSYAKEKNISDRIHFHGNQSEVLSYYHSFSLFTLSSLAEGIPMTLLEAMSCGLPVVVTKVGGIPEVVNPNQEGVLIAPKSPAALANAWLDYINNDERLHRHGEQARKTILNSFSEQGMLQAYDQLYSRRSAS
ncbi:glycosyltransferase [Vibrio sp. Of7-15]|uniref:glycosyltransferase n=1 Tax=Vibrio sp. Of7-15 TaxID=2724879 RepID=UPI001EF31304|nr:glycosyltransferase [Vibrio sp. Of7-15]MCG7495351.1 glycosyltransferase [Vibrio sp. Of7-15]